MGLEPHFKYKESVGLNIKKIQKKKVPYELNPEVT